MDEGVLHSRPIKTHRIKFSSHFVVPARCQQGGAVKWSAVDTLVRTKRRATRSVTPHHQGETADDDLGGCSSCSLCYGQWRSPGSPGSPVDVGCDVV